MLSSTPAYRDVLTRDHAWCRVRIGDVHTICVGEAQKHVARKRISEASIQDALDRGLCLLQGTYTNTMTVTDTIMFTVAQAVAANTLGGRPLPRTGSRRSLTVTAIVKNF